jgi:hypothetical protein
MYKEYLLQIVTKILLLLLRFPYKMAGNKISLERSRSVPGLLTRNEITNLVYQ